MIEAAYEVAVDNTPVKNLQWIMEENALFTLSTIKMTTALDASNLSAGRHTITVRIRSKTKDYVVNQNDPSLNFYANAYFLIER